MHYVYILESISTPGRFYIGYTKDLRERVRKHQADISSFTAKHRPWKLKAYFAFESEEIATALSVTSNPDLGAPSVSGTLSDLPVAGGAAN